MSLDYTVKINSEIGELEAVILHKPGKEVENMKPENANRALYSDILNVEVANHEYQQFSGALNKITKTFQTKDLLSDILEKQEVKAQILSDISRLELQEELVESIQSLNSKKLSELLIEGVLMDKNTLTKFLNDDRYGLKPLYNFFFMRDASMSIGDRVLIGKMANVVRQREALIMDYIFRFHPLFNNRTYNPNLINQKADEIKIEGGDVLVAREDILLIGMGLRTSAEAIDYLIEEFKQQNKHQHIIVQELPHHPESFIHLDMVFTLLDRDQCMVYAPLILGLNQYKTIHIEVKDGQTKTIEVEDNIVVALKKLGMDLEPIYCGGTQDQWIQDREQWHSGANFFSFAPGKVIGYGRNSHTIEQMNKHGFDIITAKEVSEGKVNVGDYKKCVVTIEGSELARGGGGARCMTMPVRRRDL